MAWSLILELDGLIWCLYCSICKMEISATFLFNFPGGAVMKSVTWELMFLFRHRLGWESVSFLVPGFKPSENTAKKSSPTKINLYKLLLWLICALRDISRLYPCWIVEVHLAQGTSPAYAKQGMCMFPVGSGMHREMLKLYTTGYAEFSSGGKTPQRALWAWVDQLMNWHGISDVPFLTEIWV